MFIYHAAVAALAITVAMHADAEPTEEELKQQAKSSGSTINFLGATFKTTTAATMMIGNGVIKGGSAVTGAVASGTSTVVGGGANVLKGGIDVAATGTKVVASAGKDVVVGGVNVAKTAGEGAVDLTKATAKVAVEGAGKAIEVTADVATAGVNAAAQGGKMAYDFTAMAAKSVVKEALAFGTKMNEMVGQLGGAAGAVLKAVTAPVSDGLEAAFTKYWTEKKNEEVSAEKQTWFPWMREVFTKKAAGIKFGGVRYIKFPFVRPDVNFKQKAVGVAIPALGAGIFGTMEIRGEHSWEFEFTISQVNILATIITDEKNKKKLHFTTCEAVLEPTLTVNRNDKGILFNVVEYTQKVKGPVISLITYFVKSSICSISEGLINEGWAKVGEKIDEFMKFLENPMSVIANLPGPVKEFWGAFDGVKKTEAATGSDTKKDKPAKEVVTIM